MHDEPIAIVAIVFIFGAPVVAFIVSRVLRHAERIEMLRRGMMPPPEFSDKRAYRAWQRAGSPWPPPGASPQAAPWAQPAPTAQRWNNPDDDPQRSLFKGIRVALIGFAITLGLGGIAGGFHGNPIILGGLIPMFVGIAQIIIALLSGAQLPMGQPRVTFIAPPPPHPGAPPPPQPPPGPYGAAAPPPWAQQPGRARFEELSKPVQPPDVR
jgi:hypothetical protein